MSPLYAVEVEGVVVLARARVLLPDAEERVEGLELDVETYSIDGTPADLVQRSDQWWADLWHALVAAEAQRRIDAREYDVERPDPRLTGEDGDALTQEFAE